MDDFVDIWRVFNLAFFDFVITHKIFWQKIEIPIKNMQGKFTFVKINEKICVLAKKIFQFGVFLFSQRDLFLAKSDLASTILFNTMVIMTLSSTHIAKKVLM